jgi:hypothetical protein
MEESDEEPWRLIEIGTTRDGLTMYYGAVDLPRISQGIVGLVKEISALTRATSPA